MTKLLNILLLLSFGIVSAHKNVLFQKTYGNVDLISSTSYFTEEVNKNIITAKYVEILLKELGFQQIVHLRLSQEGEFKCWAYFGKEEFQNEGLNIIIYDKETDILKTLNLVENVIRNQQSLDKYKDKLLSWYESKNSKLVNEILLNKINRPTDVQEIKSSGFFDYYYENGIYHVLSYQNREVLEVAQLTKILQFSIPTPNLLFIFTEINSLIIVKADYKYDGTKYKHTSETDKFSFKPEWEYSFRPYSIKLLGQKYITIESIFGDQVSLYNIPKKKFTQDLLAKFEE
jgi:hypothetical protein